MKFSLIIPTKDRQAILEESLERLSRVLNLHDLEVIIVNDDNKSLELDSRFDFISILRNEFGQGVASARNYGASKATHPWLIFMDDDMWVEPDTFLKLCPFTQFENRCLNVNWVYPRFLEEKLPFNPFLRYLRKFNFDSLEGWSSDVLWNHQQPFRTNGITSQFLLMHKSIFQQIGGYESSFPFAGFEDYDISKRLKKMSIEVYVDPHNMIYHNEADRLDIENWLERKKRGAVTRKVGVSLGYNELTLVYPFYKKGFYRLVFLLRAPILAILKRWPAKKSVLDSLYFLLVNIMLGTYSCIGYNSRQAQKSVASLCLNKEKNIMVGRLE